jgi:hypothetical protein
MTTTLKHDDQTRQLDGGRPQEDAHPLDDFGPEPSDSTPLWDESQFAEILESMVADEAPRLFAIVQEYGNRFDGQIAAWGMAFADRVEVVSMECGLWMSLLTPESALRPFHHGSDIRARLVWFNPGAATPAEEVAAISHEA